MFTTRTTAEGMGSRLDPHHYSPDAVSLDQALLELGNAEPLHTIVDPDRKITNGVRGPDIRASEFRLVRLQDCRNWEVVFEECLTISAEQFSENRRCRLQQDDVVVAIGGYLGNAAVVSQPAKAVIGQHSALLPFGHGAKNDSRYIVAYLNSTYGAIQFSRWSRGTVQAGLNLEDIADIALPLPASDAQAYIGSKVRQAETLRAAARVLEERFLNEVAVDVPRVARPARFTRITPDRIGSDLNPGRYDPDRLSVVYHLAAECGQRVGEFATISTTTAEPASPSQAYLGLDGISSSCVDLSFSTVEEASIAGTTRRLEAGAAISKLRPYLNKVALVPADLAGALGSTELLCVAANGVHAGFVYGVLKLDTTMRQLNPVATGATHPRVSSNDVLDVVVPMHDDHENLGRSLETAQRAYSAASRLTQAARLLVEALIERKVSEADLVAAHKSPEADRALLERLTADGIDAPDADPLFPDLDRLEELSTKAQVEEAE